MRLPCRAAIELKHKPSFWPTEFFSLDSDFSCPVLQINSATLLHDRKAIISIPPPPQKNLIPCQNWESRDMSHSF